MTTASVTETLFDEVLPDFDVRSRHVRVVRAIPQRVMRAVENVRIGGAASLLFKLRGVALPSGTIRDVLARSSFTVLAEDPGREVVAGTFGQFWAFRERAHMEAPRDAEVFRAFDRPGWAQGAISVRVEALDDRWSQVSTETRVRCVDETARRWFAAYWTLIRPFSGWLRRDFLRRVARAAETDA